MQNNTSNIDPENNIEPKTNQNDESSENNSEEDMDFSFEDNLIKLKYNRRLSESSESKSSYSIKEIFDISFYDNEYERVDPFEEEFRNKIREKLVKFAEMDFKTPTKLLHCNDLKLPFRGKEFENLEDIVEYINMETREKYEIEMFFKEKIKEDELLSMIFCDEGEIKDINEKQAFEPELKYVGINFKKYDDGFYLIYFLFASYKK